MNHHEINFSNFISSDQICKKKDLESFERTMILEKCVYTEFFRKRCWVKIEKKNKTNKNKNKTKANKIGSVILLLENVKQAVNTMKNINIFLNSLIFVRFVFFSVTLNLSEYFNVKLTKKSDCYTLSW